MVQDHIIWAAQVSLEGLKKREKRKSLSWVDRQGGINEERVGVGVGE